MKCWNIIILGLVWSTTACDQQSSGRRSGSRADQGLQAGQGGPVFVYAPAEGVVAGIVKQELDHARARSQDLLVYVSAAWCEPCKHFEDAVAAGSLREAFPRLRLLKFDFDRDEARLAEAGYFSDMIPLFVIPGEDGRATERRMEGSIKGADAVSTNIAPRLRQLLGH